MKPWWIQLALIVAFLLGAGSAMAQANLHDATQTFDGLLELIRNQSKTWNGALRSYALDIFWSLAAIQLVWTLWPLALKQASFGEVFAEILRWIMITGFYAALLLYSVEWAQAIVDSFRQAAAGAAGVSTQLQPGDMFGKAVELSKMVLKVETYNPLVAFIVTLGGILVLLCFAFIAAFMELTIVESYIVINAGVFFMAFGGSQWTRDYALSMMRYALAVGAKLFVLTLIVGLIMSSTKTWQAAYNNDEASMLTITGMAFVCAYLCKTVADMIGSLISGSSSNGGATFGGMVAAGMVGAAAGAAAMSKFTSSNLLGGAGKSVSDLIKSSFSGSGGSGGSGGGASSSNFMSSGGPGGGSGGGSGGSAGRSGLSPRTGGGGYSQPPGTPPSAQPSSSTASSGGSSNASSSTQTGSTVGTPVNVGEKLHAAAHMATNAALQTGGVLGSMAVPGMEGAAGTSIGPAPTPPDLGGSVDPVSETPENLIRPASASPVDMPADVQRAAATPTPAEPMATATKPIDSMEQLQQALKNQGKIS